MVTLMVMMMMTIITIDDHYQLFVFELAQGYSTRKHIDHKQGHLRAQRGRARARHVGSSQYSGQDLRLAEVFDRRQDDETLEVVVVVIVVVVRMCVCVCLFLTNLTNRAAAVIIKDDDDNDSYQLDTGGHAIGRMRLIDLEIESLVL